MMIFWCIIGGLFAGVVAGMGMGGGSLLIPILTLLAGINQHAAQAANMIAFIPSAIIAIIIHKKAGRINFKKCISIILYGLLSSAIGGLLANLIGGKVLRKLFAVFLIILCILQLFTEKKANNETTEKIETDNKPEKSDKTDNTNVS